MGGGSLSLLAAIGPLLLAQAAWGAESAEAKPIRLRDVTYATRGPQELKADLLIPPGSGPFPAVLLVHGGGWVSGGKRQMAVHAEQLVRRGIAAVSIDYRLAPRDPFPAQIEDCREAVRWMRRHAAQYRLDPDRIAGYGYSAGGHLVCLLAVTADSPARGDAVSGDAPSDRLRAAAAGGAVCDFQWVSKDSRLFAFLFGGSRREKPDAYRLASPIAFVSRDDPPIFLYHGERDRLVPPNGAAAFVDRLRAAGVRAELYMVKGKGHIATFYDSEARQRAIQFLGEILRPDGGRHAGSGRVH